MNKTFAPFAKPMYVMLKSVGSACNLKCEYCYYLEKSKLYADSPNDVRLMIKLDGGVSPDAGMLSNVTID